MPPSPTLSAIMSGTLRAVSRDASLAQAAALMASASVSSLLVGTGPQFEGIVTERDLVRALARGLPPERSVAAIMSRPVVSAEATLDFREAFPLFAKYQVRHLLVVDAHGQAVGIVTESDMRRCVEGGFLDRLHDIRGVMTTKVIAVAPEDSLAIASALMEHHRISSVIVERGGLPVGILTERDVVRLMADGSEVGATPVVDVMSAPVRTVPIGTSLSLAVACMEQEHIRHLVVVNDQGTLAGLLTQHDIIRRLDGEFIEQFLHERQAAIAALRESEARLRGLVETTYDWVWEVNEHGRYTYVSPQVRQMLGYEPEEILGKRPIDLVVPGEAARLDSVFQEVQSARRPFRHLENANRHKNGTTVVLETNGVPFYDEHGNFKGFRGIDRDITERKRTEHALRRRNEELEAMFRAVHLLVAMLDPQFNFVRVNSAYAAAAGKEPESFIGRNHFELYPHEENETIFRRVVESGEPFSIVAKPFEHPDQPGRGTTYWDWTLVPLKESDGRVIGLMLTLFDATDRERRRLEVEASWQRTQEALEKRVAARTAELEAANRELESFAYSVSHDLRAPLRAINGFARQVKVGMGDRLGETERGYLERVLRAAERMSGLIDDLLHLSRLTRVAMQRTRVDLGAMAREILFHLEIVEPQREVQVKVAEGLVGDADAGLTRVVLENLLNNAWKFTVGRRPAVIECAAFERDGETVFYVRDNGAGFDMRYAGKLFGAFQRLHSEEQFSGSGIGLATVQRVIHRHGGRIWAEAEPDRGATFYFTLGGSGD